MIYFYIIIFYITYCRGFIQQRELILVRIWRHQNHEVDTVNDYQKVADILDQRGYTQEDIENVMYRNWQRFFTEWLPD